MMRLPSMLCLLALIPASCASDPGGKDKSRPAERKTLSQRMDEKNGYTQDADGNWVPRSDKRSSFESQGKSPYFQDKYEKKTFKTGDYKKKSWWGNKEYGRKEFAGNTDGSRFQKASRLDGQGARESGTAADLPAAYQTGEYATTAARESGRSDLAKPSDAETDVRRRVYQAPDIIDWREQRSLSLEQSKGILGR